MYACVGVGSVIVAMGKYYEGAVALLPSILIVAFVIGCAGFHVTFTVVDHALGNRTFKHSGVTWGTFVVAIGIEVLWIWGWLVILGPAR